MEMLLINGMKLFSLPLLLCMLPLSLWAQGAGPRTNFLTPVGGSSLSLTYQGVDSNFRFGQSDAFDQTEFITNTTVIGYSRRFDLFGRFTQVSLSVNYSKIDIDPEPTANIDNSNSKQLTKGFGDPVASIRFGLIGAPALKPKDWRRFNKEFQLYAKFGLFIPLGNYTNQNRINTGNNRWGYQLSLPMVIPLGKTQRKTFLELTPQVNYFDDNTDPFGNTNRLSQDPLYSIELQVSHQFTPKFWTSVGFEFLNGGRTSADGVPNNNKLNQWFGEMAIGYIVNSKLAILGSYGRIFQQKNMARGEMLRFRVATKF